MAKYLSNRQKNLKVGISSYSENLTSLEVIGNVGIGTTNATSALTVVGNGYFTGVVTSSSFYVSNSLIGAGGSFSTLQVTGISTFTNGPVLIGSGTSTGTASQPLQVTGGAYVSGSVGIGTTNPTVSLDVVGGAKFTGVVTASSFSGNASSATYATNAGIATYATNAGIATYATTSGVSTYATSSGIATYATNAGIATYATNAGIATSIIGGIGSLTQLSVSGVSTLGTVQISSGIVTATSGIVTYYGDGSKLQGIVSVAGIAVQDEGSPVGTSVTTLNFSGTTVSVSNAVNGISTVTVTAIGIVTYVDNAGIATNIKGGLAGNIHYQSSPDTTTFLANGSSGYILQSNGVGNAPTWVSAAPAGAITGLTIRDEGNIVGSANSVSTLNFVGNIVSVASTAGIATVTFLDYVSNSGIATYASNAGIATYATSSGIATYATSSGISTYATTAGIATSVIGGISSITQLQVTGVSTFTNGPVFIGAATSTGTVTQRLQVTGGAYVSGNLGIGTTNPTATLQVKDALAFETTNTTTTSTSQVAVDTFATATFRSAKYQVQVTCPGQISTLGGITTGGRGYTAGIYNVTFTTSSGNGSAAQGTLTVSNGTVGQIGLGTTGGSGYIAGDVLTASGGSGLQVSVGTTDAVGAILTLGSITSAGIGYTGYYNATTGTGTTTLTFLGGTGTGAVGLATIFDGVITSSTLLQQPTTGTGGTTYYSGSNYTTSSVLIINTSDVTNTITTITSSVGVSTFTSLTAHGIGVSDTVRVSSTSNGLTAGTDYYVVTVPDTTSFTLGTSVGIGTTFTAGTSLSIGFYRQSAANGGFVTFTNAITGVSTNYQVSDLLVLQNGSTVDYVEYAGIANNDILGTFATDISGANARLLLTPTYPNNNVKVARQAITV